MCVTSSANGNTTPQTRWWRQCNDDIVHVGWNEIQNLSVLDFSAAWWNKPNGQTKKKDKNKNIINNTQDNKNEQQKRRKSYNQAATNRKNSTKKKPITLGKQVLYTISRMWTYEAAAATSTTPRGQDYCSSLARRAGVLLVSSVCCVVVCTYKIVHHLTSQLLDSSAPHGSLFYLQCHADILLLLLRLENILSCAASYAISTERFSTMWVRVTIGTQHIVMYICTLHCTEHTRMMIITLSCIYTDIRGGHTKTWVFV